MCRRPQEETLRLDGLWSVWQHGGMEYDTIAIRPVGALPVSPTCVRTRAIRRRLPVSLPAPSLALLLLRTLPSLLIAQISAEMCAASFALGTRLLDCMRKVLRRERVLVPEAVDDTSRAMKFQSMWICRYEIIQDLSRRRLGQLSVSTASSELTAALCISLTNLEGIFSWKKCT